MLARQYDRLSERLEKGIGGPRLRTTLVGDLAGRVLEIGAGTGRNLSYYNKADHVVAVEPSAGMRAQLTGKLDGIVPTVEVIDAAGEHLPFQDGEFDAAVCFLLLCVVDDLDGVLREIHRVLKPGGTLSFFEHVRDVGRRGRAQDLTSPLLRRVQFGCRPNRRSVERMEALGFDVRLSDPVRIKPKPPLSGPYFTGTALRR
ncbi:MULTISPECIES: class I SAM-dependent methyltransferase [unclassified Streptomyces]|uniref:class I SAM-dependent methyltransferase n=1 Tax=unclassified Streptomyces TaxID=2593676 RepID=UPI00168B4D40|nr:MULTISPECIES: class I SAM-dependent methyltransferase [unclassified Streptomyces]MBD3007230.1 class I SAM-dependent methyltransferase [Streptomyces sp. 5-10]